MRCHRKGGTRTLIFSELPPTLRGRKLPAQLSVPMTYDGMLDDVKAVALEDCVLPAIVDAINLADDMARAAPPSGRYQVRYRLLSEHDDKPIVADVLRLEAASKADAVSQTIASVLDRTEADVRPRPYVLVDSVEEDVAPPRLLRRSLALPTGAVAHFCCLECRASYQHAHSIPAEAEGVSGDFLATSQCDQCGQPLDATIGDVGKQDEPIDRAVRLLIQAGFTAPVLAAAGPVRLTAHIASNMDLRWLPGTVVYRISRSAVIETFLTWREALTKFNIAKETP